MPNHSRAVLPGDVFTLEPSQSSALSVLKTYFVIMTFLVCTVRLVHVSASSCGGQRGMGPTGAGVRWLGVSAGGQTRVLCRDSRCPEELWVCLPVRVLCCPWGRVKLVSLLLVFSCWSEMTFRRQRVPAQTTTAQLTQHPESRQRRLQDDVPLAHSIF